MTDVLIKRGHLDTETDMHTGRMPYEDKAEIRVMQQKPRNTREFHEPSK